MRQTLCDGRCRPGLAKVESQSTVHKHVGKNSKPSNATYSTYLHLVRYPERVLHIRHYLRQQRPFNMARSPSITLAAVVWKQLIITPIPDCQYEGLADTWTKFECDTKVVNGQQRYLLHHHTYLYHMNDVEYTRDAAYSSWRVLAFFAPIASPSLICVPCATCFMAQFTRPTCCTTNAHDFERCCSTICMSRAFLETSMRKWLADVVTVTIDIKGLPTRTYNLVSRKQLPLVEYACCVRTYPAAQFQPSTSTPRTKRLSAHFSIGIMAAEDVVSVIAGDANFPDTDLYHHQPCKHKATSQKLGECDQNPVNYSKLA